jgi:hypothetical protein
VQPSQAAYAIIFNDYIANKNLTATQSNKLSLDAPEP